MDDGSLLLTRPRFFVDNALHWLQEYHVEGFERHLIAENHRNLNCLVQPRDDGDYGLDAVWNNDLHHQCRVLTAGDREGYYQDFVGTTAEDIATTLRDGWFFRGEHSDYRGEPRGTDPAPVDPTQCVVFIQNHDQVDNCPTGNRPTDDVPLPVYRALSTLLCVSVELPLLFMGQEWAATSPFQFFTDHNDELGPSVTEGREEKFEGFSGFEGEVPNPLAGRNSTCWRVLRWRSVTHAICTRSRPTRSPHERGRDERIAMIK